MPTPKRRMALRGQPVKKKAQTPEQKRKQIGIGTVQSALLRGQRRKPTIGKTLTEARKTLQERKAQKAGPKRGKL